MDEGKEIVKNQETLPEIQSEDTMKIRPSASTVQSRMEELIPYAGTIEITGEQKKILFAPVNSESVEIRSDGLVYLPWMEYVSRLRDAFGISWAIIPYGMAKPVGGFLYWPFYLMIQGKLAGFAVGEQEYPPPGNQRMTYGDATEACKSNALMRLCKGIGISLELWKPSFIRDWKAKYAESYQDGKGKTKWRRNDRKIEEAEVVGEVSSEGSDQPPPASSSYEDYYNRMSEISNPHELKNWWSKHYKSMEKSLPDEQFAETVNYKDFLKNKFAEEKK